MVAPPDRLAVRGIFFGKTGSLRRAFFVFSGVFRSALRFSAVKFPIQDGKLPQADYFSPPAKRRKPTSLT